MSKITYRIVEHDGGWAYGLDGSLSETFPDHDSARFAAAREAKAQGIPDETAFIEYETPDGRWITERADGHDRPEVEIED